LAQYFPTHYVPFTAAARRMHPGSEDAQDEEALLKAVDDVMECFFQRSDLTNDQVKLYKRSTACSRLNLASFYARKGNHSKAWEMLCEAANSSFQMLFSTRRGRNATIRTLFSFVALK
jgi:hypothetical protein